MIEKVKAVFTRPVRLWLYGIGVAAVPLTTIYGVMTVEQGGAWLVFVGAALGMSELGMAALNTRRPKDDQTSSTTGPRSAAFVLALLAAGLLLSGTVAPPADAQIQGRVWVYTEADFAGDSDWVETSADNRGWCVPVGLRRSVVNDSAWRVRLYRLEDCSGTFQDIGPYGAEPYKVTRAIKILPPL